MSFRILITHGLLENVVGDHCVESQLAKLLRVVLTCGCVAYSDQDKGIGHMTFHMLITHGLLGKGCG